MAAGHGTGYTAGGAVTGTGGVIATVSGAHAVDPLSSVWFLVGVIGIAIGVVILALVGFHHGVTWWKAVRIRRTTPPLGNTGPSRSQAHVKSGPPSVSGPAKRPVTTPPVTPRPASPRGKTLKSALMAQETAGQALRDRMGKGIILGALQILDPPPDESDVTAWETRVGLLLVDHPEMHSRFFAPIRPLGFPASLGIVNLMTPPLFRRLDRRLVILQGLIEGLG